MKVMIEGDGYHQIRVLRHIVKERREQDAKWGDQHHSAEKWCTILAEEFGEVAIELCKISEGHDEWRKTDYHRLMNELIQLAAVSTQIVEKLLKKIENQDFTLPI